MEQTNKPQQAPKEQRGYYGQKTYEAAINRISENCGKLQAAFDELVRLHENTSVDISLDILHGLEDQLVYPLRVRLRSHNDAFGLDWNQVKRFPNGEISKIPQSFDFIDWLIRVRISNNRNLMRWDKLYEQLASNAVECLEAWVEEGADEESAITLAELTDDRDALGGLCSTEPDRIAVSDENGNYAGWFDRRISDEYQGNTYWDGGNHIDVHTRDQWSSETLHVLPDGTCILYTSSRRDWIPSSHVLIDEEEAARWLAKNGDELPDQLSRYEYAYDEEGQDDE